jgi:tetratricopeptide (TPR) repeat protein
MTSVARLVRPTSCAALVALAVAWPTGRLGWTDFDEAFYCRGNLYQLSLAPGDLLRLVLSPGAGYQFQPITYLSHAFEHAVFGESALAFHLVSAVLYAAVCALVAALTGDLLTDLGWRRRERRWAAFLAGALFALHPVHVEAYAWLGARKDLLATGFALAAFLVLRRARRRGGPGRLSGHVLGLVLFALAMGAKVSPMLLGGLVALDAALLDPGPTAARARAARALRAALPVTLLGGVLALAWLASQQGYPVPLARAPREEHLRFYSLRCLGHFQRLLLWPTDLAIHYLPSTGARAWTDAWLALLAGGGVAGALAWRRPLDGRLLILGGAWWLLGLLPVLNIVYLGYVNDRYVLWPSVGIAALAGPLLVAAWRTHPRLAVALGVTAASGLAALSGAHLPTFRDGGALWAHVLERDPEHPWAHTALSARALEAGDAEAALQHAVRARARAGASVPIAAVEAAALDALGRSADAEAAVAAARAADPRAADQLAARRALSRGDLPRARELLARADPGEVEDAQWLLLAGQERLAAGDPAAALAHLERLLRIYAPPDGTWLAARAAYLVGQDERAGELLSLLRRGEATWRVDLLDGQVALRRDGPAAARGPLLAASAQAQRLPPWAANELAQALAGADELDAAAYVLGVTIQTGVATAQTRYNLARVHALAGRASQARQALRQALKELPALRARAQQDPAFDGILH